MREGAKKMQNLSPEGAELCMRKNDRCERNQAGSGCPRMFVALVYGTTTKVGL